MPWKDFTSAILTSPDVDTYLMNQAVVQCTSGARPSSPPEGMVAAVQDKDRLEIANAAGNWVRGPAWGAAGRTGATGVFGGVPFVHANGLITQRASMSASFDSDSGTTSTGYAIPLAGIWAISATLLFTSSFTSGNSFFRIAIGTRSPVDVRMSGASASGSASVVLPLSSGEVVSFWVFNDSGGAISSTATGSSWECYRLHA